MSEILDNDDVFKLTRRKHAKQQIEVLNAYGIKYFIHPIDGVVIIPKSSINIQDKEKTKRQPKWQDNG